MQNIMQLVKANEIPWQQICRYTDKLEDIILKNDLQVKSKPQCYFYLSVLYREHKE